MHSEGVDWIKSGVVFEIFTAVVMNSFICCDITLCNPLNVNLRFERKFHLLHVIS
jgi:hypothetical protein